MSQPKTVFDLPKLSADELPILEKFLGITNSPAASKKTEKSEEERKIEELRSENFLLWQALKNKEELEERNNLLEEENFLLKEESRRAAERRSDTVDLLPLLEVASGFKPKIAPSSCLRLIERMAPERVCILPSAHESAREMDKTFQNGDRLLILLSKLVTRYFDAVSSGADTSGVFSYQEFSRTESETTLSTQRLASRRKFVYRGETLLMDSHLKIGIANNLRFTLRVYFCYHKPTDKLVIGWCGEHLPI